MPPTAFDIAATRYNWIADALDQQSLFPSPRGHSSQHHPRNLLFDLNRKMTHDDALDQLRLVRKPLDDAREHRDLSHPQGVGGPVEMLLCAGRQFNAQDNSLSHGHSPEGCEVFLVRANGNTGPDEWPENSTPMTEICPAQVRHPEVGFIKAASMRSEDADRRALDRGIRHRWGS